MLTVPLISLLLNSVKEDERWMLKGKTVSVVIPAFNEELLIGKVLYAIPSFMDVTIVIDDVDERVYYVGTLSFFGLILILGTMRIPYRVGWGDSANRMMLYILPIIFFYFLLKILVSPSGRKPLAFRRRL